MSDSSETEKLQEKFITKKSEASYFKKLFFGTGYISLGFALILTGASFFASKSEAIKKYESGTRLVEIIENRNSYIGESITRRQFYNAKDLLEYDLERLRLSNSFIVQSEERADYLKKLRAGIYSGLSLAILSSLGAFLSERRERKYEKRL